MVHRTLIIACAIQLCAGAETDSVSSGAKTGSASTGPEPGSASSGAATPLAAPPRTSGSASAGPKPGGASSGAATGSVSSRAEPSSVPRRMATSDVGTQSLTGGSLKQGQVPGTRTSYNILSEGNVDSEEVEEGDLVIAHAVGIDASSGEKFWSTKDNQLRTIHFIAGKDASQQDPKTLPMYASLNAVLKGAIGMRKGEAREFRIPADEAYGTQDAPENAPKNAEIKFVLEISKVKYQTGPIAQKKNEARRLQAEEEKSRKEAEEAERKRQETKAAKSSEM